jgi:hypothetical protein
MKKILFISACAAIIIFSSCENEADKQARTSVKEFTSYVDSVSKITPDYSSDGGAWQSIENGYKVKEAKAIAVEANLKEGDKKDIQDARTKYTEYKTRVETEKAKYDEKITQDKKQKMRDSLFGERKATDLAFSWVDATNIVDVYKDFVSKVNDNKDSYSKQDWDEIKMMKESLDKRKESIENTLNKKQKLKIKELQGKFSAIKVLS